MHRVNLTNTNSFQVLFTHLTFCFPVGPVEDTKIITTVQSHESGKYAKVQEESHDFRNTVFSVDCEHLIRRMLVLDPAKRLTIAQIKEHKWMLVEVPVQRPVLYPQEQENEPSIGEFNEQVLRLMHGLGIDQQKTIEVKGLEI